MQNSKIIILLVASISLPLLTGCKPGEDKAIELAKKEIAQNLKDPDSAKFRFVRMVQSKENDDGTILALVCGQVNAKNAFGAYAGFKSFMIDISMKSNSIFNKGVTYKLGHKQISHDGTENDIPAYQQVCGEDK